MSVSYTSNYRDDTNLYSRQSTSVTAVFTGPFVATNCPVVLTKIFDNLVHISIGPLPSSAITTAVIATATGALPVGFRPSANSSFNCTINITGDKMIGKVTLLTTGDITLEIQEQTTTTPVYVGMGAFALNMALVSTDRVQGIYVL